MLFGEVVGGGGAAVPRAAQRGPAALGDGTKASPAALASYTESSSPYARFASAGAPKVDSDGVVKDGWEARLLRWELQAAARELLGTKHRIGVCHRVQSAYVPEGESLGVKVYRREDSSTYYKGLMVCANSWACPVCSAKIAERRRAELERVISEHLAAGGGVYHMLLTVPHNRTDKPLGLVTDLLDCFGRLTSGKYRLSVLVPEYVGIVRALEVTHGVNGWHPHLHVLVFTESELSEDQLELTKHKVWAKWEARVTRRMGKAPSAKAFSFAPAVRGTYEREELRLVHEEYTHICPVTGYVTKWGADREIEEIVQQRRWGASDELTKGHLKKSGRGGRSPWELLAAYQSGDVHAGMLWLEFVNAFKGRAQLFWSAELRERYKLGEQKSDEQEAASVDAQDVLLARISSGDWALILRHKLRGLVLEVLRVGEWPDVEALLTKHRTRDKPTPRHVPRETLKIQDEYGT